MPSITNLQATTEVQAVNAMLASIGEAPITSLASTATNVVVAVETLRNATREVQSMGWRFNTEMGYELAPAASFEWTDSQGNSTTLNIFKPPANLIDFQVSKVWPQVGCKEIDAVVRPSQQYEESEVKVMVFYDRLRARDGFEEDVLYIDPVWLFDFEQLPELARRYITVTAARTLAEHVVGSADLSKFSADDQSLAWRNLVRVHGRKEHANILNDFGSQDILGGRYRVSGVITSRANPRFV